MTPGEVVAWVVVAIIAVIAIVLDEAIEHWRKRADYWMGRAVKAEAGPSVSKDVARLREWRKQQALRSSDHTTLHHFPADSDREAVGHLLRASGGKPS